jgi:hypothetical protein
MLIPILVIGGLVLTYMGLYILNKKTPIPEECREIVDKVKCGGCHNFACSLKD